MLVNQRKALIGFTAITFGLVGVIFWSLSDLSWWGFWAIFLWFVAHNAEKHWKWEK